jgi:hypothetical protein
VNLEDAALIFHETDCSGVIASKESGDLVCAECGEVVGRVQPKVLAEIVCRLGPWTE